MGASDKTKADPKTVTVNGRLSFPVFTAQLAYEKSQKSKYPAKSVAEAAPNFNLLLEQAQYDKLVTVVTDLFLPNCVARQAAGESKDNLEQKEVDELVKQIVAPFDGPYNTPFKEVSDKTLELAPETVATVKVTGNKGVDLVQKAAVYKESDLLIPDSDILKYPVLRPIDDTTFQLYAGCYVAVTLNLYAYHNGKLPGFSAGATTVVFKADGDRFGGGTAVDEDEIFLD